MDRNQFDRRCLIPISLMRDFSFTSVVIITKIYYKKDTQKVKPIRGTNNLLRHKVLAHVFKFKANW